jgi:triacylglycerol lipase
MFDPRTTSFSAENALLLAKLCNIAYLDETPAQTATVQLGLTNFQWIHLIGAFGDCDGFVASGNDFAVLAFRGTKDAKSWMDDLEATPVPYPWLFKGGPEVGQIHAGFGHALCDAWPQIRDAINKIAPVTPANAPANSNPAPTLWITGHSLGGALAVLAGAALSIWSEAPIRSVNGIYTFGQPRVGLYSFCGNYDHVLSSKTFRFVNNKDLVPRVPFRGWDYADVGQMIHFDKDGTPELESVQWASFLSRTISSFQDLFSITANFNYDVGDHSMAGYERLVQGQSEQLDALFPRKPPNTKR